MSEERRGWRDANEKVEKGENRVKNAGKGEVMKDRERGMDERGGAVRKGGSGG